MQFSAVAKAFQEIESRSGRLEMTDLLAALFREATSDEIDKLIYIIQGTILPSHEGVELGMGEKFALEAIAAASGYPRKNVDERFMKLGDLGLVAMELLTKKKQQALFSRNMDVKYVYDVFMRIAKTSGAGSQDLKIKYLTDLLNSATPLEAKFISRFVVGQLRLGVGDPTILDALSVSKTGTKGLRDSLERAYNLCSDLGYVAKIFYETPKEIDNFKVQPLKPLRPALAERLSTPKEIIEKIGPCAVERKYDGFRMQCHKEGDVVVIFSRKLENITHMFPDVVATIKSLKCHGIIFEGEALAYNEKQKRFYSFQETMHRRRKHGIEAASKELPLNVFCFDILYLNGKDLTVEDYETRRKYLEKIFPYGVLRLSEKFIVKDAKALKAIFDDSLAKGLEGIMAKDLKAPYIAGKRKFAWIKLKKSYGKSMDTVDVVIVGYYAGKGARAEFEFGGLLTAVFNEDSGRFETIAKIGSGYSEDEMVKLQTMLEKIKTANPSKDLDFRIRPDFWVKPKYVVEVAFDEITQSPTHTCGLKQDKGYALRFPRMVGLREDKGPKEVTTTREIMEMFERQKRAER